jgi:rod shape determining protein RodA
VIRNARDQFDWPLFVAVATLSVVGVINLYSATSVEGSSRGDIYITQIYWLTLGAGVAVLVSAIDYRHYERLGWVAYGFGLVLLVLVFLLGRDIRGSTRWISLGGFSLQSSELMKIMLIIALAKYLHHDSKTAGRTLKDLIVPGLIAAVPIGLVLLQPDLGTAVMLALIFGSIMVLTQLKARSLLALVIIFTVSAPISWKFLLHDYQRDRVLAFIDPHADLLDTGWHSHQSLVAIGSGGVWGKGFMQGTQSQHRFLPDQHTDFPFSVWAEEQGLVGVLALLGLYGFLILWAIKIASQAKDRFGAVVAVGVSAMLFWHTAINVGMVTGLLPVVGITLPLFSYGGSSVLATMLGIGLLMNVSMRRSYY